MWNLTGTSWQLASPRLIGSIDPGRPWNGFCPQVDAAHFAFLLGIWFNDEIPTEPLSPIEIHARGTDLIAGYAEHAVRDVRPEFLWQLVHRSPNVGSGLELIASAQTSKLSSDPRLVVRSRLAAAQVFQVDSSQHHQQIDLANLGGATIAAGQREFFLMRPRDAALSYAEFVHPSDFVRSQVRASRQFDMVETSHDLFAKSLEKGVIRRGRVCGMLVPRERDIAAAREAFDCFSNSKPLLSA